MSARKIGPENENPIDNIMYSIAECMVPIYYKWGWTPNFITALSMLSSLVGAYLFHIKYLVGGTLMVMLGYYFDCCDGYMARKYSMITEYGDYFDHITDIFTFAVLLYVFWLKKKDLPNFMNRVLLLVLSISLCAVHYGCQEILYDKNESPSFAKFRILCPNKKMIKYTRFFGGGSLQLLMCLSIIL